MFVCTFFFVKLERATGTIFGCVLSYTVGGIVVTKKIVLVKGQRIKKFLFLGYEPVIFRLVTVKIYLFSLTSAKLSYFYSNFIVLVFESYYYE